MFPLGMRALLVQERQGIQLAKQSCYPSSWLCQ